LARDPSPARILIRPVNTELRRIAVKEKTPVVKQLYRLSVEPRVVDQLAKLAERLREPRSRLASRLFTEAVMGAKLPRR
jgi:hypothetical protein